VHREQDAPQRPRVGTDRALVERLEGVGEKVGAVRRDVDLVVLELVDHRLGHDHHVRVQRHVHGADRLAVGSGQMPLGIEADRDDLVQQGPHLGVLAGQVALDQREALLEDADPFCGRPSAEVDGVAGLVGVRLEGAIGFTSMSARCDAVPMR
jgi:hypothetical protein